MSYAAEWVCPGGTLETASLAASDTGVGCRSKMFVGTELLRRLLVSVATIMLVLGSLTISRLTQLHPLSNVQQLLQLVHDGARSKFHLGCLMHVKLTGIFDAFRPIVHDACIV